MTSDFSPEQAAQNIVRIQAGIEIAMTSQLSWDTEIKADLDGEVKQFIYLDAEFDHIGGELVLGEGIEKLEWVQTDRLSEYDNVPPNVKVFEKLGFL